ncbi:Ig-like domain-containing protein, partial [Gemmatimonas sp.]|uniref:Ig-like domain-containing protein n=1 Tax=Gemmatimonas sp. TaxID=1962908 RepID=UPI0025C6C373
MRMAVCAVVAMSVAACGGGGDGGGSSITTPPPVAVGSVAVTLPAAQVQVGAQLTAQAEVRSAAGAALSGRVVAWSSSNGAVASVTDGGVITGVAPGTVSITATSEGRSGSASLTVIPVPVASIVVSAPTPSVVVGQTLALSVSVRAADGSVLAGRPVEYSSSSTAVATVSNTGVVTGIAPGAVTITVRSGAVEGSIAITVLPVPVASITLSAP